MTGLDYSSDDVRSFDGTDIAARQFTGGTGTPVLLCNAVGANLTSWKLVLERLVDSRPALAWDYRGLLDSAPPASPRIDPGAHAEDAIAVLDHFGVEHAHVAAWSTGSRVGIEIAHRYPERIEALALVCGGYGFSLPGLAARGEWPALFVLAASAVKHFGTAVDGVLRAITSRPELGALIRHSGFVGATADTAALVDLVKGMASCDGKALLATYEAVVGDSALKLLREIHTPTLAIAGERDPFTPGAVYNEMRQRMPNLVIESYEGATHFLPLEQPARLAEDLDGFFAGAR